VENYFNYFTEIEEHFQRRRGTLLMVSTLDWALMEIWKDAGIPLEAVLRGIDAAFDRYNQRSSKARKINGLGWCAQAVLAAAEDMKEAAVGAANGEPADGNATNENATRKKTADKSAGTPGLEPGTIAAFLRRNADLLSAAKLPEAGGVSVQTAAVEASRTLRKLADETESKATFPRLEDLERRLTVLEEKLFAALLAATPDEEIVTVRAEADHDLAPYRRKMASAQIEQLQKQYVHKRLLEKYGLPRLSLFYM
jgi:hypothetical protein